MTRIWKLFAGIAIVIAAVVLWNYVSVSRPVAARLSEDSRNAKVSMWAYHQYGLLPSVVVLDLRGIDGEASSADVLRVLFHSAEGLKDEQYERVVLSYKGRAKFMLDGEYFQKLGQEFKIQNPIYTMRTLPQNVHRLDGSQAFGTWTGGLLGVLGKQMEDLREFAEDWYLNDMIEEAGG